MRIQRDRVRKKTFGHIEQELFSYHETKREIQQIRNEWIHRTIHHDNPGASRNSLPSDPTGNIAAGISDDESLKPMEEIIEAIELVVSESDKRTVDFIHEFYFSKPRMLTMEGIAQKLYLSRMQLYRKRTDVVRRLAQELGWW